MPDHRRVDRPEWQALWRQYEPVTTPLRAAGLVCDVDTCGGQTVIYANLPDGTHLAIGCGNDCLPDRLQDVTGWIITRGHDDNPNYDGLAYNSSEGGEHAQHGADIISMLAATALYLGTLPDPDTRQAGDRLGKALLATAQRFAVSFTGVDAQHATKSGHLCGPFDSQAQTVKEYGWQTHLLQESGWDLVHEQGGDDRPLTVWRRAGAVQVVFVSRLPLV
ncbi:hypothetical protein [Streptomyces kebangsaanensis]|uniref:hypothetical protein n=1 Tax=Streptomyces kebangsaanensis TaxID=864058 RepID=UPI0009397C0C|nr:hypothetical protein [Streptomyces kebangsaanensis]